MFQERRIISSPCLFLQIICCRSELASPLQTPSLPSAGALGKASQALGKGFAERHTRQRSLGKDFIGKKKFCRVPSPHSAKN
jgi:hypothetical protein